MNRLDYFIKIFFTLLFSLSKTEIQQDQCKFLEDLSGSL